MTLTPVPLPAFQSKSDAKATAPAPAAGAPIEKDIADAKARGLVWVNTSSKVYRKEGEFYGKTKRGSHDEGRRAERRRSPGQALINFQEIDDQEIIAPARWKDHDLPGREMHRAGRIA